MRPDEPITLDWLLSRGWKLDGGRNDPNHRLKGFCIRPVGHELRCGPRRTPIAAAGEDDALVGFALI